MPSCIRRRRITIQRNCHFGRPDFDRAQLSRRGPSVRAISHATATLPTIIATCNNWYGRTISFALRCTSAQMPVSQATIC